MTRGYLPIVLAAVLIGVLTFVEGYYLKDRWGSLAMEAGELGKRFSKVPKEIGPWKGQDLPVDEVTRETAGAVNYVSRIYRHNTTHKEVILWLIVGHSRDIVRHTPSVCYPSAGFRQQGSRLSHHIKTGDGKEAVFFTARFNKEDHVSRHTERVFWAWNHPDHDKWDAPEKSGSENARFHYGLARALYKLYFTSNALGDEKIEDNAAIDFAKLMLPAIDAALFPEEVSIDAGEAAEETSTAEAVLSEG